MQYAKSMKVISEVSCMAAPVYSGLQE